MNKKTIISIIIYIIVIACTIKYTSTKVKKTDVKIKIETKKDSIKK